MIVIIYLLEAWPNSQRNVDENGTDVALLDLRDDLRQAGHGLQRDQVHRVIPVIHTRHHSGEDSRGVLVYLQQQQQHKHPTVRKQQQLISACTGTCTGAGSCHTQ